MIKKPGQKDETPEFEISSGMKKNLEKFFHDFKNYEEVCVDRKAMTFNEYNQPTVTVYPNELMEKYINKFVAEFCTTQADRSAFSKACQKDEYFTPKMFWSRYFKEFQSTSSRAGYIDSLLNPLK